ncbi:MAG: DUF5317 family protein [Microthrixaceae bacterium]
MALIPTLLAISIGVALGMYWGGRLENLLAWRPPLWQALLGGVVLSILVDLIGVGGFLGALLVLVGSGAILAFAVVNVRVGGMVLVVAGVGLNVLVHLINWGTPVSGSALVSAGIVERDELGDITLTGGRELADGSILGFLGDSIGLPWGHVVSIGDLLTLVGICLVTASVVRRYEVGSGRSSRGGPMEYRSALDALGRGPAPRRGPGLHPSRMEPRGSGQRGGRPPGRRGPGSAPR